MVSTGIETDEASFEKVPLVQAKMYCTACGEDHYWSKLNARLTNSISIPLPGWPLNTARIILWPLRERN